MPAPISRSRRPAVLDASRTALIPLRPLTIGEILDGGFLIVRRNIRLMVGVPLVLAGGYRRVVDGTPRPLPDPFMVAATQNPVEYEGTYPLPAGQL